MTTDDLNIDVIAAQHMIVTSNAFTMARHDMHAIEMRLLMCCIAAIQNRSGEASDHRPELSVMISERNYHQLTQNDGGNNTKNIIANCEKLLHRTITITEPDMDTTLSVMQACEVIVYQGFKCIYFELHEDMYRHFIKPNPNAVTKHTLADVITVKSRYVMRFYRIFCMNMQMPSLMPHDFSIYFTLSELMMMFAVEDRLNKTGRFKKVVLRPTFNTLNAIYKSTFSFTGVTKGKTVVGFNIECRMS